MATEVLAAAAAAANSADIVVASGASANLFLKPAGTGAGLPVGASVLVQYKTSGNNYVTLAALSDRNPAFNIVGPVTLRVSRGDQLGGVSVGVEQG